MITVGQLLKEARLKKNISLDKLENITRIKKSFIAAIERNDWDRLPEYPVVSGFVKNLATTLDVSSQQVSATLRRDYLPKKLSISPKPDLEEKFSWSPKMTFAVGIGIIILLVLGYLGIEYFKFISPPPLEVNKPAENETVLQSKVFVSGKTATDVILTVNNQPVIVDEDGNFKTEIAITKETSNLKFIATSRSGKMTEVNRSIKADFD